MCATAMWQWLNNWVPPKLMFARGMLAVPPTSLTDSHQLSPTLTQSAGRESRRCVAQVLRVALEALLEQMQASHLRWAT